MKRLAIALLSITALITACHKTPVDLQEPTVALEFGQNSLSMNTTDTSSITSSTLENVTWYSSDTSIATVNQLGQVTAIAPGTTTIWAKTATDSTSCTITVEPTTFIAGSTATSNQENGTIYKNALPYLTIDSIDQITYLNTISLLGGKIYSAGTVGASSYIWQNDSIIYQLTQGATVTKIIPTSSAVYSVGYTYSDFSSTAAIWKNSTQLTLSTTLNPSAINDAILSTDSTLYCVGYITDTDGNEQAVTWKNDTESTLTSSTSGCQATAIAQDSTGNTYITGYIGDTAVVWTNGVIDTLSSDSLQAYPTAIALQDGNVYIAGFTTTSDGVQAPVLWTNGTMTTLSTQAGVANSVAVYGTDICVVGQISGTNYNIATLWANGTQINLSDGLSNATANAVVFN